MYSQLHVEAWGDFRHVFLYDHSTADSLHETAERKSRFYLERLVETFFEFVKIISETVTVRRDGEIPMQKQVFPRHHSSFDLQSEVDPLTTPSDTREVYANALR